MINFIDMPLNLGCNRLGVEEGGKYICDYGLKTIFTRNEISQPEIISCKSITDLCLSNKKMKNLDSILDSDTDLADRVFAILQNGNFPLVFGGDHSLTWGSISGVSRFFGSDIGCIYLDAHGDFNSEETSFSGNVHGMHMYYLMGFGNKEYVDFYRPGKKISHNNVFFLGTRSLDEGERILASENNFNILTTEIIHKFGVEKIFKQLSIEIEHFKHIHFSVDIDCIDPVFAPGTGVPEQNGLTVDEVEYLITKILSTGKVVSMDLVEFNPRIDLSGRTLNVCVRLLKCIDSSICK